MSYGAILAISAINATVAYFAAYIAAAGDGGSHGLVKTIQLWAWAWIALTTVIAWAMCQRGRRVSAVMLAAACLPLGVGGWVIATMSAGWISLLRPNAAEFERACQSSGAVYLVSPAAPVTSIAFDWPQNSHPPDITSFSMDALGNISGRRGGQLQFPPTIDFTESRCCRFEGRPLNGVGPFVRHPQRGSYYGITELTADVLVTYTVRSVTTEPRDERINTVELLVSDRRDGRTLATLNYVLDDNRRRACGSTSEGVMNERAFILKAIGVP